MLTHEIRLTHEWRPEERSQAHCSYVSRIMTRNALGNIISLSIRNTVKRFHHLWKAFSMTVTGLKLHDCQKLQ